MKSKLRKIKIENKEYLYAVTDRYHPENQNNTLTVKVFLVGNKLTPLVIDFFTSDHYYMGQLLNSGIDLKNEKTATTDTININRPKFIRELILQGIQAGWVGTNKMDIQDGLNYLNRLGYETSSLQPNK